MIFLLDMSIYDIRKHLVSLICIYLVLLYKEKY